MYNKRLAGQKFELTEIIGGADHRAGKFSVATYEDIWEYYKKRGMMYFLIADDGVTVAQVVYEDYFGAWIVVKDKDYKTYIENIE